MPSGLRRRLAALAPLAAIAAILAADACREPTQMTLVLDADAETCARLRDVAIVVGSDPQSTEKKVDSHFYATATTLRCDAKGRIGSLVMTPGSHGGTAAVVVIAGIEFCCGYSGGGPISAICTTAANCGGTQLCTTDEECKDNGRDKCSGKFGASNTRVCN